MKSQVRILSPRLFFRNEPFGENVEWLSKHKTHALRYTALVDDGRSTFMPPVAMVFAMVDELLLLTRLSTQEV